MASLLGLSVHTCEMGMLTPASEVGGEVSARSLGERGVERELLSVLSVLFCPVGWLGGAVR